MDSNGFDKIRKSLKSAGALHVWMMQDWRHLERYNRQCPSQNCAVEVPSQRVKATSMQGNGGCGTFALQSNMRVDHILSLNDL